MIENLDRIVIRKIQQIVEEDNALQEKFYDKWGIKSKQIGARLLDNGLHGGAWSKLNSIKNLNINEKSKVLNIGPEIGVESFMLAELCKNIYVADPDDSSLKILEAISNKYVTEANISAKSILSFINSGFKMSPKKISSEKRNYTSVRETLGNSLPTYYDIQNNSLIRDINHKYDLIFVHKIITTLSRFTDNTFEEVFINCVNVLIPLLDSRGRVSWTEPRSLIFKAGEYLKNMKDIELEVIEYPIPILDEKYIQYVISRVK